MAVGEDIVKSIEEKGSSPELIVAFLSSLSKNLQKHDHSPQLILTINKIRTAYSDIYDYYQPTKSVLSQLHRRLESIRPLLEELSISSSAEENKAIEAIVANQLLLNSYSKEKSKWSNFKDKVSNKFRSPLEPKD